MVGRDDLERSQAVDPSPELAHRGLGAEHVVGGMQSERDHDARVHELDLAVEERRAELLFLGPRIAVLRRPALEDVRDVDVRSSEAHALRDDVGQELSRPTDEGDSLLVFVVARRFADEHHARPARSIGKDRLRAGSMERTSDAARDGCAKVFEVSAAARLAAVLLGSLVRLGRARERRSLFREKILVWTR